MRAVARATGHDVGAVSRELRRLEQQGALISEAVGRSRVYAANDRSPIARELRTIVQRTYGVEARLRRALADLDGVEDAWIFGSHAAGDDRPDSDIDVMVVGTHDSDRMRRRIAEAERELDRDVSIIEYTPARLRELRRRRDPFIIDVLAGPRISLREALG